ncbi:MAG: hypothetical protein HY716_01505 [Planctomycetes bacterium]|nr:hypothetical protein [Planctomycetota bacterium]
MSGWLAAKGGATAWERALRRIPEAVVETWRSDAREVSLAVWRKERGEYRHSGRIHASPDGRVRLGWVGIAPGDDGDRTMETIGRLSGSDLSADELAGLNAAFAAVRVDAGSGELHIWSDRHRQYPVYLLEGDGTFVASTDFGCVAAFLDGPRLDPGAADLLLHLGHLVEDQTLLSGIRLLQAGAEARVSADGGADVKQYWRLRHRLENGASLSELADEIARRVAAAVRRIQRSGLRLAVPVSGGLDSRLLLSLTEHPERVPSLTWGEEGSRDLRYGERIAARLGSPHTRMVLDPAEYPPLWERGVAATGGAYCVGDMHVLPFACRLAEKADVTLNGLGGDGLLGGIYLKSPWMKETSLDRLVDAVWQWRIPHADVAGSLLRDSSARGEGRRRFDASFRAVTEGTPAERLMDWTCDNRLTRFTNCGSTLLRTEVESYAPFLDRDVVDYLSRIPLAIRIRHRLYLKVLKRASPTAAKIPWERTALAPRWGCAVMYGSLALQRGGREIGKLVKWDPFQARVFVSQADWYRGPWSDAVRGILLDDLTLERGVFDPDAVRGVWEAHQNGRDLSKLLGNLLALELFHRRFLDPPSRAGGTD